MDLATALRALTAEDLRALVRALDRQGREVVVGWLLGPDIEPRFLRPGGRVLRQALRATRRYPIEVVGVLLAPALEHAVALLGDRSGHPTVEDLRRMLPDFEQRWGRQVAVALLSYVAAAGMPAAAECRRLLGELEAETSVLTATQAAEGGGEQAAAARGAQAAEGGVVQAAEGRVAQATDGRVVQAAADRAAPAAEGAVEVAGTAEQAAAGAALEAGAGLGEEAELLFTPLDQLLIHTAVATATGEVGAPSPDVLAAIIDEALHLNTGRARSYFHAGFLEALVPDEALELAETGLNDERRLWLHFGRLSGWVRRGDQDRIRELVVAEPERTAAVVAHPRMGHSVTAAVITALLGHDDATAARLLDLRVAALPADREPFLGWQPTLHAVHLRARELLAAGEVSTAEALWRAVLADPAGRWRMLGQDLDVERRLVSCLRARNDFPAAAAELDRLADDGVDRSPAVRAALVTERALVVARVAHLRHLRVPAGPAQAAQLVARLEAAEPHLREALGLDGREWRARYALGVLELLRSDLGRGDHYQDAATHLEVAVSAMADDEIARAAGLEAEARFHWARAQLAALIPGTDGPAAAQIRRVLEEGYRPAAEHLTDVLDALAAHGSAQLGMVLEAGLGVLDPAALVAHAGQLAARGDARGQELAWRLAQDSRLSTTDRCELLTTLARTAPPERASQAVEDLEELVVGLLDHDWDQRLADLAAEPAVREALGALDAELLRLEALRRLGAYEAVAQGLEALFHRAVKQELGWLDATELLRAIEETGADPATVARLERVARASEAGDGDAVAARLAAGPVRVVFLGGNETQARHRDDLEAALADRFGAGRVEVRWFLSGWGANWADTAEQVEAALDDADALVVMSFVRTLLGRRVRRAAGERGVPWVPCTGHGRESLRRALEHAVEVAARLWQRDSDQAAG